MHRLLLQVHYCQILAPTFPRPSYYKSLARHSPFATINNNKPLSTSTAPSRSPENEYVYIEDVEMMERYRPGGYHLVSIGDKLHDWYRVIHKLGHGGYSTIWLARDERSQKLAAIKVGTAESNPREVNVLSALATAQDTTPREGYGRVVIPPILDGFNIQGRNGIHPCYVTAPGQATISEALEASDSGMFELNVARALVAQLALAVAFIHSQGIVHGGEFSAMEGPTNNHNLIPHL